MRLIASACLTTIAVACAPACAGFLPTAVIDDFSGSAGLGFTRVAQNGATFSGDEGFLGGSGAGFQYLCDSPGYDASAYSGISLKVSGSLGTGGLFLSVLGSDLGFVALDVDFGSTISNGYAWITFNQIDAAVGNDPGTIQAALAQGTGFAAIGLSTTGNASITVDDFQFGTSAVPGSGSLALLAVAGLITTRRRG